MATDEAVAYRSETILNLVRSNSQTDQYEDDLFERGVNWGVVNLSNEIDAIIKKAHSGEEPASDRDVLRLINKHVSQISPNKDPDEWREGEWIAGSYKGEREFAKQIRTVLTSPAPQ